RLPHSNGGTTPKAPASEPVQPTPAAPSEPASKPKRTSRFGGKKSDRAPGEKRAFEFLPAFWTIASVMSFTVNIVVLIVLIVAFYTLKKVPLVTQTMEQPSLIPGLATNITSELLGGLHSNFVKMDEANIRTTIHVEKEIPVQFSLNVSGPTNVTLSQAVTIRGALVTVETGGLNIVNARATIVLPEGTLLPINIENLVVPVDQKVLASLDVPVDIPLNQTELHEPFVGLQKVVEPWYCLINPDVSVNGEQVCLQTKNPLAPGNVAP
ncbi:MAG: hypothetical protein ACM33V_02710, partial [Chloroflexota bacterium]